MVDIIICANCSGSGNNILSWECEKTNIKCNVCKGSGKLDPNKHYKQTWSDGTDNTITSFYYGPPLDGSDFKNYKIYDSS